MKIGKFAALLLAALVLAGCSTTPQTVTKIVEVPSSAPYRFITFSGKDDPKTIREIKRHNRAHQAVIEAEKKAKSQH
jgi:uncharacterized lipoprotein YajG